MQQIYNDNFDILDNIKKVELPNGFKIISYENPNYTTYYANYNINYGGLDFEYYKNNNKINTPPGTAHFLEHMLFKMPDGDAFEKFSLNYADANAYTSYEKTSYLFSTKTNFIENIENLLKMVNTPYFTDEEIKRENLIITEEIGMYEKNPDYFLYKKTGEEIFENAKYKYDILGEKSDIDIIDKNILEETYKNFYTPNNSFIVIVGPDLEEGIKYIKKFMEKIPNSKEQITKIKDQEKLHTKEKKEIVIKNANVEQQYYSLSVKLIEKNQFDEKTKQKYNILLELILLYYFNEYNEIYNQFLEENLINYTLNYDYIVDSNYIVIIFSFINLEKNDFYKLILEILKTIKKEKFDAIISLKNKEIGKIYRKFDDEKILGEYLTKQEQNNIDIKNIINYVNKIQTDNINIFLKKLKEMEKRKIEVLIKN